MSIWAGVRREDVLPGGRYAGGRFAPPVAEGESYPRSEPPVRELREWVYHRIQDQGYLRAQLQADPQAAAALATADAVDGFVAQLAPLLAGFVPEEEVGAPKVGAPVARAPLSLEETGPRPEIARRPGDRLGGTPPDEGEFEVAGLQGLVPALLMRLLTRRLKKPPTPAPKPRVPASRPSEQNPPAPHESTRPERPLTRAPDQASEPLRDALHEDPAPSEPGEEQAAVPEIVLPDVSEVPDPDNMLLADEFDRMPETGLVDPNRIRTSQDSAGKNFGKEAEGEVRHSITGTAHDLAAGRAKPEDIPPIEIIEHDGKVWAIDHRRLIAARLAKTKVHYRKVTSKESRESYRRFIKRLDTRTDGLSIRIRKGSQHVRER